MKKDINSLDNAMRATLLGLHFNKDLADIEDLLEVANATPNPNLAVLLLTRSYPKEKVAKYSLIPSEKSICTLIEFDIWTRRVLYKVEASDKIVDTEIRADIETWNKYQLSEDEADDYFAQQEAAAEESIV